MGRFLIAAGLAILGGALLISQPPPGERAGPRRDGSVLLNSGWVLRPAGRQVPLSTFPMASAVAPGGKHVVVLNAGYFKPTLSVRDASTFAEVSSVELRDAWLGLTFAPNSSLLYVSGGSASTVQEFALTPEGRIETRRTFPLVAEANRKHTDFIGDVAVSPDGRLIYAAALYRDSIFVINPQSGMVIEEFKSAHRPYRILFHPDGNSFYVSGWGDGTVLEHDTSSGKVVSRTIAGPQPMDMVLSTRVAQVEAAKGDGDEDDEPKAAAPAYAARLFVAVSNTNTVAVLGIGEDRSIRQIERINASLYPVMPAGMTPSALALSADNETLYIVCSDANTVAVASIAQPRSRVTGFVPTAWYPTSAQVLPGGRLLVLNGKGARSFPNPGGPNPTRRTAPVHLGNSSVEYVGAIQRGSASIIEPFDNAALSSYSRTVLANSPYRPHLLDDTGIGSTGPVPSRPGASTPIQHVIYIVKENRTYDQVLGSLGIGNGDPNLTLFGEDSAPNHHKLAREFVLLDNFYVNADVSADGHNWSSAAIAPAYVQRLWPNSYGARRRHYDYEGGERAATPPAGYIWTNVLARGLPMRNYGWWVTNITPAPSSGRQVKEVRDPALTPHTNFDFRGFDLEFLDVDRARVFIDDLKRFETENSMPRFMVLRIGNDHTSGTSPNKYSPRSAMADNDLALGMIVEAVSKSKFWPSTAIFVLEDDAQNGPDHVDSHRSPAYILSPYTRGRGVDSSFYNTTSMLRTMELILGLHPMTAHDAGARPMANAFQAKPDPRAYEAVQPRVPLTERNPAVSATARRSQALDLTEADRIDDHELNDILWRAIRGTAPPAPTRSFFGN